MYRSTKKINADHESQNHRFILINKQVLLKGFAEPVFCSTLAFSLVEILIPKVFGTPVFDLPLALTLNKISGSVKPSYSQVSLYNHNSCMPVISSYRNLQHSSIPRALFGGISPLPNAETNHAPMEHSVESLSGRELLRKLIADRFKQGEPGFTTLKYEKPSATLNGDIVSVSFSHTSKAVSAVVSKKWVVGIDMEFTDRRVNDRLAQRMKHSDEAFKFYENNPIIKIWTMKEAALKAIGTGLRKPMNSVCLQSVSEHLCSVRFFNGINAEICSFQMMDQWISICYILPELTESYLSEAYVPIQARRD